MSEQVTRSISPQTTNTLAEVRFTENICRDTGSFRTGVQYDHNIVTGTPCGATDTRVATLPPYTGDAGLP